MEIIIDLYIIKNLIRNIDNTNNNIDHNTRNICL